MARIRKLSINGVRNFDDDVNPPTIRFNGPLTLILGPNGTGKTTIIECLRYALSGDLPPDAEQGRAFVHEPMLKKLRASLVRANVKLEFVDRRGSIMTVSRTLEASRTEKALKVQTLDSSLAKKDKETGQSVCVTGRCVDINTEVLSAMGLSKAIINYVLFCHQDDSNWPFASGQKLKERFDEIFDTTRYNKGLDNMRKLLKEKKDEIKHLVAKIDAMKIIVNEVRSKQRKLQSFEERRTEAQERINKLTGELKPINERLAEIKEVEAEHCKWVIEEEKKKFEYNHAMEQIQSLKENIKEPFEGSTESLQKELESYEEILQGKNNEIKVLEREIRERIEKENKISKLIADRRVTVGSLRQQMQDQALKIAKRNDTLRDMMNSWEINETVDADVSEEGAAELVEKLEDKLRQLEQETEAERVKQEQEQEKHQRKINVLRGERSTVESQLAHNESELIKIKGDIRANRALLRQSGTMEQKLNEVDENLTKANKNLEEYNKTFQIDSLKRKIGDAVAREEENERKFNIAEKEIALLRQQGSLQMKLESSQAELMDKEKEVQILKEKHKDTLRTLLAKIEFPEGNMMSTMNDVQATLNKRVLNLRNEIEKVQLETMTLKTSVEHKKKELDKKTKEIQNDKERVSLQCKDYTNYREVLLMHSKKVKDLEDKRGMYAYQGAAYKEYIKQLNEPEACCPLCRRGFDDSKDATILVSELKNDMSDHPDRLRNCEKELSSQRKKYDSLLQLQPVVEKIENFESNGLTKMREEIDTESKKLSVLLQKVKSLQDSMTEPEKKLSYCKNMIGDMALWDRYSNEIESINATVAEYEERLRNAGLKSGKTLQEAQTELDNLQRTLKDTRRDIKELQATLDSRNEQLRRATESRTKLLEQQLRIHQEMQEIKLAKEALDGLLAKEIAVNKNVQSLEERVTEIDNKLATAIENFELVKQDIRTKQESVRKLLRERSKDYDQLNSIHTEVKQFHEKNIDARVKIAEDQLKSGENKASQLKTEREEGESKLSKMKQNIIHHDSRKRDLMDNFTLRQKEIEAESLRSDRRAIKNKLQGANLATISQERKSLIESRDSKERETNIARGSEEELALNIKTLKQELEKPEYKDARKNYDGKCAELVALRHSENDLVKFCKVLDVAMIKFHEERMNTVNKIMKKLWKLIYTGTDTSSIQIRTEATTNRGDKRQFNYKFVQIKHDVEMDMKGRCSAGQKVLASIILRLALAETFCESCGVLALDEPTTNLDDENARSLADALHKYVKHRKSEQSFHLIVITHDDNFIPELGQLSTDNSYYELYRNDNGMSCIKRVALTGPHLSKPRDVPSFMSEEESDNEKPILPLKRSPASGIKSSERKRKRHAFE